MRESARKHDGNRLRLYYARVHLTTSLFLQSDCNVVFFVNPQFYIQSEISGIVSRLIIKFRTYLVPNVMKGKIHNYFLCKS